jgi:hypothetical protein
MKGRQVNAQWRRRFVEAVAVVERTYGGTDWDQKEAAVGGGENPAEKEEGSVCES